MNRVKLTCVCGVTFEVYGYRKNTAKYCSRSCLQKYRVHKSGYKCPKGSFAKLGAKNPMFGKLKESISLSALHDYIRKRLPKASACGHCGDSSKPLDMANKSHEYKRELTDWIWLCRKCHVNYDGHVKNLELGRLSRGKFSDEHKENLRIAHLGQKAWNKGLRGVQKAWNKGLKKEQYPNGFNRTA
jgi:hypothetical protein